MVFLKSPWRKITLENLEKKSGKLDYQTLITLVVIQ